VISICKSNGKTAGESNANLDASANVLNDSSPDRVDPSQLKSIPRGENLQPAPIDGSVDKWFFISGAAV
jgi:hypothetical protein